EVGVDPEVLRLTVVDRRDHVPGRPATGEVVEGGEGAGHVERRVVDGRVGGAEPDAVGDRRADPEHDGEVQLDGTGAQPDGVGHRCAVDARHGQPVVEEHEVEATL